MLNYAETTSSSTIVSPTPVPCRPSQAPTTEPLPALGGKSADKASKPAPELLPMALAETFTASQKRAALAGQQYYLQHLYGTYASHQDLCAFLKRKLHQWDHHHTSTAWQIYWIAGWQAALRTDPTAALDGPRKQGARGPHPVSQPMHQQQPVRDGNAASVSDRRPVPPLATPMLPETLSTLLAQPDFLAGLGDGQQVYRDNAYEGALREAEMLSLVERNLGRRARERDNQHARCTGVRPPSYVYALGLVVGVIGTGLVRPLA